MRDNFEDYKKTLESGLVSIDYLFSGDVIGSQDKSHRGMRKSNTISTSFIIECLESIYSESFEKLSLISDSIVISKENNSKIDIDFISNRLGFKVKYIFMSKSTASYMGYHEDKTRAFPPYFYPIANEGGIKIYYSPSISDEKDSHIMYCVSNSFQSLVYSLQNMEYDIIHKFNLEYIHEMRYKIYDCKFESTKVILKQLSRIREDKISEILS